MSSDDGMIHVVFNDEIYNHVALREEMKRRGHGFRSTSDTEVLLRLYEAEGLAALHRLNGMFAVAVWDRRSNVLHLVRDRLGVKPLYYATIGNALVFASEVKAILASGCVEKRLNEGALWDYLTFRYVPTPETMWLGITKLPPAHVLTVGADDGAPRVARW